MRNLLDLYSASTGQSPYLASLTWVSDLLQHDSNAWNAELISSSFTTEEANQILAIPLSQFGPADCLVWSGEPSGHYSIRSDYRLLLGHSTLEHSNHHLYQSLWSVASPSKIKLQVWKFIKNFTPTKCNLFNRRIANDPFCPLCTTSPEDNLHVARDCVLAYSVWSQLGYSWPNFYIHSHFKEWLYWVFQHIPKLGHLEVLITIRALWLARNKKVHDGIIQTTEDLITFIRSYCKEVEFLSPHLQAPAGDFVACWSPPAANFVKINFDTCLKSSDNFSWPGIAIWNQMGAVMGANPRRAYRVGSVFATEAWAALHVIVFTLDMGFRYVVVEGNRVAHMIARDSSSGEADRFWVEETPFSAASLMESDKRGINPP
ncbi:hypothetical protein V6N13_037606 [Hibiscus sabdariffa]